MTEDKHASNQSFRAMIDQATGSAVYGISASAGGTDGSANQRELGLATDTGTSGRDGVAASGDWTVTTYFTEAEIDAISSAIVRGKGTTGALPSTAGAGEILRASLAKAHDTNAQARAIANYVKATGPKGLGALRSMAGLETNKQRDEIALVPKSGTNPFLGPDGKAKLQAKMVEFQRRIDSPEQRSSIAKDISGELVGLDVRLNDLRHDKFPDLPVNLLIEERDRVSGFITVLEAMRATTAVTSDAAAAKAEARLDGSTLASLAGLGEAAERCAGQSSRAQSAFTSCRKRYYRHIETTDNGTRSMRSEFAGYYEKIDPNYAMAVAALDAGYMMSRHLEAKSFALAEKISNHATLADIKTLAGEIATYSDGLAKGYARAADLFVNVSSQLDVVWDKWSDSFTNPIDTTPKGI